MKELFLGFVCTFIVTLFIGCSVQQIDKPHYDVTEVYTTSAETTKQEVKVKMSDLIPDPRDYFFNTEFEMATNDDSYIVYLDYVTIEEWESYIEECERIYWTNETYRSDYSCYIDSDDDEYTLMLDRYGNKNEYMTIIVKVKEE